MTRALYWDKAHVKNPNDYKNIVTFKYNGTITALNAIQKLHFHCEYSVKWENIYLT